MIWEALRGGRPPPPAWPGRLKVAMETGCNGSLGSHPLEWQRMKAWPRQSAGEPILTLNQRTQPLPLLSWSGGGGIWRSWHKAGFEGGGGGFGEDGRNWPFLSFPLPSDLPAMHVSWGRGTFPQILSHPGGGPGGAGSSPIRSWNRPSLPSGLGCYLGPSLPWSFSARSPGLCAKFLLPYGLMDFCFRENGLGSLRWSGRLLRRFLLLGAWSRSSSPALRRPSALAPCFLTEHQKEAFLRPKWLHLFSLWLPWDRVHQRPPLILL